MFNLNHFQPNPPPIKTNVNLDELDLTISRLNIYDKVNLSQIPDSIYSTNLDPAQQLTICSSLDPYLDNPIPLNQMFGYNCYNLVDSYFQQNFFTSNSKVQALVLRNLLNQMLSR